MFGGGRPPVLLKTYELWSLETDCEGDQDQLLASREETSKRAHLREVDVNSAIVDEHVIHLEVRPLRLLALLELDKRILERVACLLVANNLARQDGAEPREDELQVLALGDLVELADEEDVLWWCHVGEGKVAHHLESEGLGASVASAAGFLESFGVAGLLDLFLVADTEGGELGGGGDGRGFRDIEADGVGKGVVCEREVSRES